MKTVMAHRAFGDGARLRCEQATDIIVLAYEQARGWTCERAGHLKIGFDVRRLGPADQWERIEG